MTNDQSSYIHYQIKSSAAIRLFCFHHSGGGASFYYPWLELLSPHIELISILLPGRENRFTEPLNNNLKEITAQLSDEFLFYKDKPFFVFGHSLGALLAFEFIKSIQQKYALYPRQLIISAAKAPHMPYRRKQLSELDDSALKEELKIYNGIDEKILSNDELFDLFLPVIRNDFSIVEKYNYINSKPFPFNILALSGVHDQTVNEEEVLGWSKYTTRKFEHISFSGAHFFIKDHPKIVELINKIGESYC